MIITNEIEVKVAPRTLKKWRKLGYNCEVGDKIKIDINHLSKNSHQKVEVSCDNCEKHKQVYYYSYNKSIENQGKYYCKDCKQIKIEKTNIEKYGVKRPIQNKEVYNKLKSTNIDKYGFEVASKSDKVRSKLIKTNLERYGYRASSKNPLVKDKMRKTIYEKLLDKYKDLNPIKAEYKSITFKCDLNHEYDITYVDLHNRLKYNVKLCTICNPISINSSIKENEVYNFIESIYDGEILKNHRIDGKELDIYLPNLNLAFEFNGLYWHSDIYKDKYYHLDKTKLCNDSGIKLFHIWEDDWTYRKEIVMSMIKNKIGIIDDKIYARKCEIKLVEDINEIRKFLNDNHLQGYVNSSIKIGLFYNGDIVSLLTVIKRKDKWEINRFVNKRDSIVVGGFSKLLKYFVLNHKENKEVFTFADVSWSDGGLYEKNGFTLDKILPPDYYYVIDNQRKHKFNFRKSKINKPEREMMIDEGIPRIYNCGIKKYKL